VRAKYFFRDEFLVREIISVFLQIMIVTLTLLLEQQEGHLACKKTEWCGAGVVT